MSIACFGAGVAVVNAALVAFQVEVLPGPVEAKLAHLREHRDDYDLIFLGSSHVDSHIDPHLFDQHAAALGHPTRSFNFGIPGMGSYEADQVLDRILALELPNLKWIVIDTDRPSYAMLPGELRTERSVWWHTLEQTRVVIGATLIQNTGPLDKARVIAEHLEHFFWRALHVGMGQRYLSDRPDGPPRALEVTRGFRHPRGRAAPAFKQRRGEYEERVVLLTADPDTGERSARPYPPLFVSQAERLSAQGVTPIYLLGPILDRSPEMHGMAERGDIERFLHYDRPSDFPQLYTYDLRFNEDHMRGTGARLFTSYLARDVAAILEGE